MPGRHAAPGTSRFWRDFAVLIGGILGVAVLVFGGLWLADRFLSGDDGPTTTLTTLPEESSTTEPSPTSSSPATTATTAAPTTTTAPATTTSSEPEARPPSEVTVQVLNHVDLVEGAAGRLTERLAAAGYQTLNPSNYTGAALAVSVIEHDPGFEAEAAALLEFVPDAEVEESADPDGPGDVVIRLGESFDE